MQNLNSLVVGFLSFLTIGTGILGFSKIAGNLSGLAKENNKVVNLPEVKAAAVEQKTRQLTASAKPTATAAAAVSPTPKPTLTPTLFSPAPRAITVSPLSVRNVLSPSASPKAKATSISREDDDDREELEQENEDDEEED